MSCVTIAASGATLFMLSSSLSLCATLIGRPEIMRPLPRTNAQCGMCFAIHKAAMQHAGAKHGLRTNKRLYADADGVCKACSCSKKVPDQTPTHLALGGSFGPHLLVVDRFK